MKTEPQAPRCSIAQTTKFLVLGSILNCLAGYSANWVNISQILEREGAFLEQCPPNQPKGCQAQKERLSEVFALALPALFLGEFLGGVVSSAFGSRFLALLSTTLLMAGTALFAVLDRSDFSLMIIAEATLLASGAMLFFSTVAMTKAFAAPRKISSLFISLYFVSYVVPVLFNILNSTEGYSRQVLFMSYLVPLGLAFILTLVIFPTSKVLEETEKAKSGNPVDVNQHPVANFEIPQIDEASRSSLGALNQVVNEDLEAGQESPVDDCATPVHKKTLSRAPTMDEPGTPKSWEPVEIDQVNFDIPDKVEYEAVAGGNVERGGTLVEYDTDTLSSHLKKPVFLMVFAIYGVLTLARGNMWLASVNTYMTVYGDKSGVFTFIIGMMLPFNFVFSQLTGGYAQSKGLPKAMTLSIVLSTCSALVAAIPIYQLQLVAAVLYMVTHPFLYTILYSFAATLSPKHSNMIVGCGELLNAVLGFSFNLLCTILLTGPFQSNFTVFFLFLAGVQLITLGVPIMLKKKNII